MKKKQKKLLQRYAIAALSISGLALILAIGLSLFKLIIWLGLFTPKTPDALNTALLVSGVVTLLGLAAYALLVPDSIRRFFSGRQGRYGSNAVILTIGFLVLLVAVNLLGYNSTAQADLTEDKQNTLAPETLTLLETLTEPVSARAYYSTRMSSDAARDLLINFRDAADGNFDFTFIDPEINPVAAQQDGVARDGTIILNMGGRREVVTYPTEQEMFSALLRLTNPQERAVYFLTGHGEHDTITQSDLSMTMIAAALGLKNYQVGTLNLGAERAIPENALAIIVAGPQVPLSQSEVQLLAAYLQGGGSLVVMEDPTILTDIGDQPDPLAAYLSADWGITLQDTLVVDPRGNPASLAVSYAYGPHPITERMGTLGVVFPEARSLLLSPVDGVSQSELVYTAAEAWGETDFNALLENQAEFDPSADTDGPILLAAAAENSLTGARVVVIGDSDFAVDANYTAYGNSDFLMNAIDWAAEQESLIGLTVSEPISRSMKLITQGNLLLLMLSSICLLPLVVLIGGLAAWITRRNRG